MPPHVYRVFNGWTGNGAIHRVVLAESEVEAIRKVRRFCDATWFATPKAERVMLDEHGIETDDIDL